MPFMKAVWSASLDYKLWLLSGITLLKVTAQGVTQFVPTVVATFGYSSTDTLLLTAPPYLFAMLVTLVVSRLSDRKPERCYYTIVPFAFGMAGSVFPNVSPE